LPQQRTNLLKDLVRDAQAAQPAWAACEGHWLAEAYRDLGSPGERVSDMDRLRPTDGDGDNRNSGPKCEKSYGAASLVKLH
jgi:hypothetical protein